MLHTPYVCVCVYALCFLSSPPRRCWGVRKGLEAVVEWLPGIFQPPNPPFPAFFSSLYPRGVRTSAKKKRNDDRTPRARDTMPRPGRYQPFLDASCVCGFKRQQRDFNELLEIEVSLSRSDLGNWWSIFVAFCQHFFFFWIHILEKNSRIWMTCLKVKFSRFLKKVILRAILSIFTCEKWYLESDSWKFLKKQSQGYLIILRQWLSTSLVSKKEKK